MTTPWTEPVPEVAQPVIPSKGYVLELVSELVPRDWEDDWLWREEASDA